MHETNLNGAVTIAAAYLNANRIPANEVGELISGIYKALARLGPQAEPAPEVRTPAVPFSKAVAPSHVTCLECGVKGSMLKRHLMTAHGLSPEDYLRRWNLPGNFPLTAPDYSKRRRELAIKYELGRHLPAKAAKRRKVA